MITSLIGFILATVIAIFIYFRGPIILPFARLGTRKRTMIRWLFIIATIYSYTIETIQNFRGFNPRFSREGDVVDKIARMLFGLLRYYL
ncbi:hypothetical protein [Peribacillus sp. NPDC096540]|uniref:hypothetical protein n=1 Tax=Peribacillus sp. NPDC096540 TaxID=3390612 RepID=UPI003D04DD14